MPWYLVKGDHRIWEAETPGQLADALRQELNRDNWSDTQRQALTGAADTFDNFIRTWPEQRTLRGGQTVRPAAAAPPHADDAKSWLEDLMEIGLIRKTPNFDNSVKVILATFTVFTGLTLTRFLTPNPAPVDIGDFSDWHWWGFFALVALLLRYIIGSAIHLNHTYGGDPPRSIHVFLLFKDLMFLVFFGMLALYIMEANRPDEFVRRAMLFVLAGFAWSIIDYLIRQFVCLASGNNQGDTGTLRIVDVIFGLVLVVLVVSAFNRFGWNDIDTLLKCSAAIILVGVVFCVINGLCTPRDMPKREWPGPFWRVWTYLDGAQFLLTGVLVLFVPSSLYNGLALIMPLAILYIAFLFLDMVAMIRALQFD